MLDVNSYVSADMYSNISQKLIYRSINKNKMSLSQIWIIMQHWHLAVMGISSFFSEPDHLAQLNNESRLFRLPNRFSFSTTFGFYT